MENYEDLTYNATTLFLFPKHRKRSTASSIKLAYSR